jgi:ankyrin repeat protein
MEALIPGVNPSIIENTEPLYYAASFGMTSVVKAILVSDPGLDINAPGGRVGATPLFAACWRHNYDVAETLLKAGADPKIADPGTGVSVLGLARMSNFLPVRDLLLRCNVELSS